MKKESLLIIIFTSICFILLAENIDVFIDSGQCLGGNRSYDVSIADVDNDGDLDAFVANVSDPEKVWLNDGTGMFEDSGQNLGNDNSDGVMLGDLNGDGFPDAFVVVSIDGSKVWFNQGDGTFVDSGQVLGQGYHSRRVGLADYDNDGDLDAFVTTEDNGYSKVWFNDGSGYFSDSGQELGPSSSWGLSVADIDGDDDLDVLVANYDGPNILWLNDGFGYFVLGSVIGSSNYLDVELGDFDSDGDLDILAVKYGENEVWINNGSTLFADSGQRLGNFLSRDVKIADFDNDEDLDAFVVNCNNNPNKVWLNDGHGYFIDSGQELGNQNHCGAGLGDFNRDGKVDVYVAIHEVNLGDLRCNRVYFNVFEPLIKEVEIDIKPGSYPNSINLGSNGNVPVAIFSSDLFDATTVDPLSVTLAGAEVRLKGKGDPMASFEDVNSDGLMDIIVHVDTRALELSADDTAAILEGATIYGQKIRGVDTVRIVPE